MLKTTGLPLLIGLAAIVVACGSPDEPSLAAMTTSELLARGRTRHELGELGAAVAAYRMVLHRDSLNAIALGGLSSVYGDQGRKRAAQRYMRKAIHLAYTAGLGSLGRGDTTAALVSFDRTLALLPRHALALIRLGDVARARGDADGAIGYYRRAAEANPNFAESSLKLGAVCAQVGRDADARAAYEAAIAANLNAFDAYVGLAELDTAAGQWAAAADQYGKALLIRPDSEAAQSGLNRARRNL